MSEYTAAPGWKAAPDSRVAAPDSKLKVDDEGKRHGAGSSCGRALVQAGTRARADGRRPAAGREGPRGVSPLAEACECGERLA